MPAGSRGWIAREALRRCQRGSKPSPVSFAPEDLFGEAVLVGGQSSDARRRERLVNVQIVRRNHASGIVLADLLKEFFLTARIAALRSHLITPWIRAMVQHEETVESANGYDEVS
jgi:hypothetical protein